MTSWYAVGVGLIVLVVAAIVGILVPGLGQFAAVFLGGVTAGYVGGGGLRRGFWHGLLTGAVPGLALAIAISVALLIADFAFRPVGMLLGSIGLDSIGSFFTITAYAVLLALTIAGFAVVGGIGGVIGGGLKKM